MEEHHDALLEYARSGSPCCTVRTCGRSGECLLSKAFTVANRELASVRILTHFHDEGFLSCFTPEQYVRRARGIDFDAIRSRMLAKDYIAFSRELHRVIPKSSLHHIVHSITWADGHRLRFIERLWAKYSTDPFPWKEQSETVVA